MRNALDSLADAQQKQLSIKCQPKDEGIEVVISDTGCGIAKSVQGKVFEPFFTTKKVGEGSGLGLAQVAELMRAELGWDETMEALRDKEPRFVVVMDYESRFAQLDSYLSGAYVEVGKIEQARIFRRVN